MSRYTDDRKQKEVKEQSPPITLPCINTDDPISMESIKFNTSLRIIFPVTFDYDKYDRNQYKVISEGHCFNVESILDKQLLTDERSIREAFGKQLLKYPYDRTLIINPEVLQRVYSYADKSIKLRGEARWHIALFEDDLFKIIGEFNRTGILPKDNYSEFWKSAISEWNKNPKNKYADYGDKLRYSVSLWDKISEEQRAVYLQKEKDERNRKLDTYNKECILDNYIYYKIDTGIRHGGKEIHMLVHAKIFDDEVINTFRKSACKDVKDKYTREKELTTKETEFEKKMKDLEINIKDFETRDRELKQVGEKLANTVQLLQDRGEELERNKQDLEVLKKKLDDYKEELSEKETDLDGKKEELSEKETDLEEIKDTLERQKQQLEVREDELAGNRSSLEKDREELEAREEQINLMEYEIYKRLELKEVEKTLKRKQSKLEKITASLAITEQDINTALEDAKKGKDKWRKRYKKITSEYESFISHQEKLIKLLNSQVDSDVNFSDEYNDLPDIDPIDQKKESDDIDPIDEKKESDDERENVIVSQIKDGNLTRIERSYGTKEWHDENGELHRDDDLPAVVFSDKGSLAICCGALNEYEDRFVMHNSKSLNNAKMWYRHGKRHRDGDRPAVELSDGTKEWWKDGELYREEDRPAVEYPGGAKEWYQNGVLHRDGDRPAIIGSDGTKMWYRNGELHRDNDLPTMEYADGKKEWRKYSDVDRYAVLHRDDDLPAVLYPDGREEWYKNGEPYIKGEQPPVIDSDGTKSWYKNGVLHRDGDKPAVIGSDGTKEWWKDGKLYRDGDKPAIEHSDGTKECYKRGLRHRHGDYPAVEYNDGGKEWYKSGKRMV